MAGKAPFIPPVIEDNHDGWGPCAIPTAFKDIPYQPFSKGDRLGKVKPKVARFYSVTKCHVGFPIFLNILIAEYVNVSLIPTPDAIFTWLLV